MGLIEQPGDALSSAICILLPVYNDTAALRLLLADIHQQLSGKVSRFDVVVVDDGSTNPLENLDDPVGTPCIGTLTVLELRRNLGHQRAIAIGLSYIEGERPQYRQVVVMDSDGEDAPADICRLLDECEAQQSNVIVFAERAKRSENLIFRVFYQAYRLLHWILTARSIRIGNFSVIPRRRLESLVATSELWNHYAAAAIVSRQPLTTIPTARAKRLAGRSKMNFVKLVIHGLSAISVYSEMIGVRLLIATVGLIGLDLLAIIFTVFIRLTTSLAIPGWATTAFGLLLVVLLQATLFLFVFSSMILAGRNSSSFLPLRDYAFFIRSKRITQRP